MRDLLMKFETPFLYVLSFLWAGVIATYVGVSLILITNSI